MTEEAAEQLVNLRSGVTNDEIAPPKATSSDETQTSESSTTQPTTPSSNEFDPSSQREPVIPALARLAKIQSGALSRSASQASAGKTKAKLKPRPKAPPKPKTIPAKRAATAAPKSAAQSPKNKAKKASTPAKPKPRKVAATKALEKGTNKADPASLSIAQFET